MSQQRLMKRCHLLSPLAKLMLNTETTLSLTQKPWLHPVRLTEWKASCEQTEKTHRGCKIITNDKRNGKNTHTHALAHTSQLKDIMVNRIREFNSAQVYISCLFRQMMWLSASSCETNKSTDERRISKSRKDFIHNLWFVPVLQPNH